MDFTEQWAADRAIKRRLGSSLKKDEKSGYLAGPAFTIDKKIAFMRKYKLYYNIGKIAKMLDLDRKTIYDHFAMDPQFRHDFTEIREAHIDEVEEELMKNAKTNPRASAERIFFLKSNRRKIYGNKMEVIPQASDKELVEFLGKKMKQYQIIPKNEIVDAEVVTEGESE